MSAYTAQRAGSLVFFARNEFISRCIALRTCSWKQLFLGHWISHVGILVEYKNQLAIVESTTQDLPPCIVTGTKVRGVQMHFWDARLDVEHSLGNSKVWMSKPKFQLSDLQTSQLTSSAQKQCGKSYAMFDALVTFTAELKQLTARMPWEINPQRFFCSELVAWLCRQISVDVIPIKSPTALVWPAGLARVCARHNLFLPLRRAL